jgi:hypothetical protein
MLPAQHLRIQTMSVVHSNGKVSKQNINNTKLGALRTGTKGVKPGAVKLIDFGDNPQPVKGDPWAPKAPRIYGGSK